MYMRLVHLWGARAKHAVTMRMPTSTLPRRATYVSTASHQATARGLHSGQGEQCWHS